MPQRVTQPLLDYDSSGVEAREEELLCDQLPCEETVCADDAETVVEEPPCRSLAKGDDYSVDGETRGEESLDEQQSGDSIGCTG